MYIEHNTIYRWTVDQSNVDCRLDHYLAQQFPSYSRNFFQRLIEDTHVSINGKRAEKAGKKLRMGDLVSFHIPPPPIIAPSDVTLQTQDVQLLHEHEHFLIVYKPAGLIVHAPHVRSTQPSLVDWIKNHYAEIAHVGTVDRPGIVHRLDKDTSGLIIIPRTNHAYSIFSELFRSRAIEKRYYAIVTGRPPQSGTINTAIGRHMVQRALMTTYQYANPEHKIRESVTHYQVTQYFNNHALVDVKPVTGRTHQIRVHFKSIGHPLLADHLYGTTSPLMPRQALHAYHLSFNFDGHSYNFTSPIPSDFQQALARVSD